MKELTERQEQVLNFIRSYMEENSCPPTVREAAEFFSISLKAVQDHFLALRKKGYLSRVEKRSRSLKVLIDEDSEDKKIVYSTEVPILGSVAAGKPIFCEENYKGSVTLFAPLIHEGSSYFALTVQGTSMMNAGILDGDLAIIRQQTTARNGQIVVALLDDSVTLKRFFKESSRILLQPENPEFNPIYCQDVKILGTLVSLIRSY